MLCLGSNPGLCIDSASTLTLNCNPTGFSSTHLIGHQWQSKEMMPPKLRLEKQWHSWRYLQSDDQGVTNENISKTTIGSKSLLRTGCWLRKAVLEISAWCPGHSTSQSPLLHQPFYKKGLEDLAGLRTLLRLLSCSPLESHSSPPYFQEGVYPCLDNYNTSRDLGLRLYAAACFENTMQPKLVLSSQSPASDSQVTGLQVCATTPSNPPLLKVCSANFFLCLLTFYCLSLGGLFGIWRSGRLCSTLVLHLHLWLSPC